MYYYILGCGIACLVLLGINSMSSRPRFWARSFCGLSP